MLSIQIAQWVQTQQSWASDAARRLVLNGRLTEDDIQEILALAKAAEGLASPNAPQPMPLTDEMVPAPPDAGHPLTLVSLSGLRGVNALAPNQTIEFAPQGLTVVYGDNGAGKSGYSRVLQKMCRARAAGGPILGNVFAEAAEAGICAQIVARRGDEPPIVFGWRHGDPAPAPLSTVAVFDSQCARAFNDAEGEIAYTPRGLDLLASLASLCGTLRERLEAEMQAITASSNDFADMLGEHAVGIALARFDRHRHLPGYLAEIEALGSLSDAERDEAERLARELAERQPIQRAVELRRLKTRIDALAARWSLCETALSDDKASEALALGVAFEAADGAAGAAAVAFAAGDHLLTGTGSAPWLALLKAARDFSALAYAGHDFPHVDHARCVLCQQALDPHAAERLNRFETFVAQAAQRNADTAKTNAERAFTQLARAEPAELAGDEALLAEMEHWKAGIAEELGVASHDLARRQAELAAAWEARDFAIEVPPLAPRAQSLLDLGKAIEDEAARFNRLAKAGERKQSELRLADLNARQRLAPRVEQIKRIAGELDRKQRLSQAHAAADSGRFSRKMQTLHAEALSEEAEAAFARECAALRMQHVPIKSTTRMDRGKPKQQLKLNTRGAEKVGNVLSEGEQRALALAMFLAEVSLIPGHGAIVFDDPMSSLDHARRELVAVRLAKEALVRQVIVFTHDLAFANHLADAASRVDASATALSVRRAAGCTGIVHSDLPFAGIRVAARLEILKAMAIDADSALNVGDAQRCDEIVRYAYGRLRETWERGVEEGVLNEAVVRFRPGVSTQRLRSVCFDDDHFAALEAAMSRASHFAAHDGSTDANVAIPSPEKLREDIECARVFFADRTKLNKATDERRRRELERAAAFKQT